MSAQYQEVVLALIMILVTRAEDRDFEPGPALPSNLLPPHSVGVLLSRSVLRNDKRYLLALCGQRLLRARARNTAYQFVHEIRGGLSMELGPSSDRHEIVRNYNRFPYEI